MIYNNKLKLISIILIFSFYHFTLNAQTKITGKITSSDNNELFGVNVVLKEQDNVVAYGFSNIEGLYALTTDGIGDFSLEFTSLGFNPKIVEIKIEKSQKVVVVDVALEERSIPLNEIIIQTKRPISIRKDTITFQTADFTNGTEQNVEDLLQKIPGLQVDNEGTIKVGNQEIEKLMIDGDDFFEKGYKILSKNMPAYPIEEVEIFKNYSNNRLLKGVEESNKVALNLKLDKKFKQVWFGNIEASLGNDNFYQLTGNLMNFGKENKYYFLTNLNNIGYDATGDVRHLIRPFRLDEPTSIGDNQSVNSFLSLSPAQLSFKQSRTNFNNAELISLNAIFNPTERLKIKPIGFLNWDESNFIRNSINVVNVNSTNFTNTENLKFRNKKTTAFGKLDVTYDISESKMLKAITKYSNGDFDDDSELVFNNNTTIENLQHQSTLFDQKISYADKFKDKKVFLLTGRFIDEKVPQRYQNNRFFYQELFPETPSGNNVSQSIANKMQFAGIDAHLLDRKKNGHLLELQLGNEFRIDKLETTFSLLKDDTLLRNPDDYQNQTTYKTNELYLKSKYRLDVKNIGVTGKLNFHQLINQLENSGSTFSQTLFFINPSISLDWRINNSNKIVSSYKYSTTNATIMDVYSDFILTGFRSFSKGTGDFNQLDASSLIVNYQLGNWGNRFFASATIAYNKNHDFFSANTRLNQNLLQTEKLLIKDRSFISVNSRFDYYFESISSNLKLDLSYTKSEFKNIVNNSNLRAVVSDGYIYGLELRSGFTGVFNYHIGTKWTTTEIRTAITNSFTNNMSFLDLSFVFSDKFDIQIQLERYYFGNIEASNNYYFWDFDVHYRLIENKLTLGLTGKNLFNTKEFRELSVSDIGISTVEYRLLPRFVLLKLAYRF